MNKELASTVAQIKEHIAIVARIQALSSEHPAERKMHPTFAVSSLSL